MTKRRRILIVGAGAVGQVYGYHLHRGGAEVTFQVKEEHLSWASEGFRLHRHRLLRSPKTVEFQDYDLVTQDETGDVDFDQVWLCVSATALEGRWLEELAGRIEPATLVALQPGLEARNRLEEVYSEKRLVYGMITLIAYQAPLPGEQLDEGIAYLLPPLTPTPFSGPSPRVDAVVEAFEAGGIRANHDPDTSSQSAFGTAILIPTVAGLELAGWSLRDFRKSHFFELATAAAREALEVSGLYHWKEAPWLLQFVRRPEILGLGTSLASAVMPFDLEAYLRFHFRKTGDQTRQIIARYIELGQGQGSSTYALRLLRGFLEERPHDSAAVATLIAEATTAVRGGLPH